MKNLKHQNNVEASEVASNGQWKKNLKQKIVPQKTTRHKEPETQSEGAVSGTNSDLKALLTQFTKTLRSTAEKIWLKRISQGSRMVGGNMDMKKTDEAKEAEEMEGS